MTDKELFKLALEALELVNIEFVCNGAHHAKKDRHSLGEDCPVTMRYQTAITAIKEALAQPKQKPRAWLVEFENGEEELHFDEQSVGEIHIPLYTHPPQRTEQEPVELPCCGYTDASAVKWNPFNGVVQCHNCGQCYTTPPQRTEQEQQIETLKRCLFQMQEAAKDLVEQAKSLTPPQRTEPVIDKSAAIRIATALGWTPPRTWVGLTYEEETELIRLAHNHAGIRFYIQAAEAKLKEKNA